jgi:O-antigen/teichoic acid export membrane protein
MTSSLADSHDATESPAAPSPEGSLTHRILRNTLSSVGLQVALVLINVGLVPFVLRQIGAEAYGLWALTTLLVGLAGIADLGISNAIVKYTASLRAQADFRELSKMVGSATGLYFLLFILYSLLMVVLARRLTGWLGIPAPLFDVGFHLFIGAGGLILLTALYILVRSVLIGLQCYDLANLVTLAGSVLNLILTIVFLLQGHGLYALWYAAMLSYLCQGSLGLLLVRKQCPQLHWSLIDWDLSRIRSLLTFGFHLQVISLGTFLNFQLPKVFLSLFATLADVGYYQIAYKVLAGGRELSIVLYSSLVPAAAHWWAQEEREKIRRLYLRGTKYLSAFLFPFWAFLVVFARPLVQAWIGPGYDSAAHALQVVAVGNFILLLAGVASSITQGSSRPQLLSYAAGAGFLLNVTLALLLGRNYGFEGVLAALSTSLAFTGFLFLARFHRVLQHPIPEIFTSAVLKPALATILPIGAAYWIYYGVWNVEMTALPPLIAAFAVVSVLYVAVIRFTAVFTLDDIRLLRNARLMRFARFLLIEG